MKGKDEWIPNKPKLTYENSETLFIDYISCLSFSWVSGARIQILLSFKYNNICP